MHGRDFVQRLICVLSMLVALNYTLHLLESVGQDEVMLWDTM